jgi:ADP-ribosylglycohydrolase
MLGAITGDIIGSRYEFENCKRKDFQPLFHPHASFTDDTICTVALADALTNGLDPTATLRDWCHRYWNNGGWGQRFALWLSGDNPAPYDSFGNGAAMRVSPAGLLAGSETEALEMAYRITAITHNHPEGIKAGQATALAIWLARQHQPANGIRQQLVERFGYNMGRTVDDIRPGYTFTEASQGSVPEALICALQADSFEDAMRNAISIGGDSDTIAAIAGGVAEALFGIPDSIVITAWAYLPADMQAVMRSLYRRAADQRMVAILA